MSLADLERLRKLAERLTQLAEGLDLVVVGSEVVEGRDIRDGHVLCGECGHPERSHDSDDWDHPTRCGDGAHRGDGEWEPCGCEGFRLRVEDGQIPTPTLCDRHSRARCLYCAVNDAVWAIVEATSGYDELPPSLRSVVSACHLYFHEDQR